MWSASNALAPFAVVSNAVNPNALNSNTVDIGYDQSRILPKLRDLLSGTLSEHSLSIAIR